MSAKMINFLTHFKISDLNLNTILSIDLLKCRLHLLAVATIHPDAVVRFYKGLDSQKFFKTKNKKCTAEAVIKMCDCIPLYPPPNVVQSQLFTPHR